ncbi:glycoside hydrolase family 88 protein [Aestuariibaculum suncheonense]|uniref:Glycoside hydrolase family 88 protein n=1 Tax=Aestuariibaculum suncheonense TaxID=1028745 RepID=A0A8J6Q606_9FLAO|nr:glycoside hydrolase family 88 protein [Aestuariibaculum suncheonense]MBD0834829.1 glycoside hydrolase family 88 protein [Aestuariibaculum suncheonense]
MVKQILIITILIGSFISCKKTDPLLDKIDETLKTAATQYEHLLEVLPEGRYPKTYHANQGELETSRSGWWCSGFYPGSLLYLNEDTSNPVFQEEIKRVLEDLQREQYNTTTHDLGFMMYCSFGNAERLHPSAAYKNILMNSAKSLASRFNDTVGCIKSWDSSNDDYLVIIDNMMNLELLFWASKYSKDPTYYDIAVTHANTTMQNHFRNDYSSYHVLNYSKNDGSVKRKRTAQGYSDASAWARGQAWALYGYTVMYRETKDKKYLAQANGIAGFILNHPNMPKDMVPYWDFDAPDIPNALRDSSAGAIMASALLELGYYVEGDLAEKYITAAKVMISTLTSEHYIAHDNSNGGFLLKHGVGHIPEKTEIDVPLTYGDYYLIEAMMRYKHHRI